MDNVSIGEVIALSKAFGGGGGSSGGGVLVANGTFNPGEGTITLDKTWQEIFDSTYPLISCATSSSSRALFSIMAVTHVNNAYSIVAYSGGQQMNFDAETADGYPVAEISGGGNG